jgi:hypothetical protein
VVETFDWLKPSMLWQADGLDVRLQDFFRPQVLEIRTDTFMDDFLAAAAAPTARALRDMVALAPTPNGPLKLFQPNHGCFYLVCSSLCCRVPSFPDREIHRDDGERVFFVLRKVIAGAEYAWCGAQGWQALNGQARRSVVLNEERLPLMSTIDGNGRDILFGYLPVAGRETYDVPPAELAVPGRPDMRVEELNTRFSVPAAALAGTQGTVVPPPPAPIPPPPAKPLPVAFELASVYLLLDLWEYLNTYLPDVAAALRDGSPATITGDQAQAKHDLLAFLASQFLGGSLTLTAALGAVARNRDALNAPATGDDAVPGGADEQLRQRLIALGFDDTYSLQGHDLHPDTLEQKVGAALPALSDLPPTPVELPKLDVDALYVLRCVYERPQCDPPVQALSLPSAQFQLAPFFDPDAPGRQVRIPLPADVSVAGMRKFKKNVMFMMSDSMRRKVNSIADHEKALLTDTPSIGSDDSGGVALVCSFSIEIIFIVAFFLLLMFVIILNFVFWWIAFFKICLPIPKKFLPG